MKLGHEMLVTCQTSILLDSTHRARRSISKWIVLLLAIGIQSAAMAEPTGWDAVPGILSRITPPKFAERDFPITEFGAVDDGVSNCRAAFDAAISACHKSGGGRVVVPAGNWISHGPIHLKSNVNLHLQPGSTVKFSTQPSDYLPLVLTRFEGNELMGYSPFIYAFEQENIAITGQGTIDGQAGPGRWWNWKGPWGGEVDHGWRHGQPSQEADVNALRKAAEDNVPARERIFGNGHYLRPNFVQTYRCKNVLIEGVTIVNSPMWIIHPVLCENVIVRGVTVNSHGPNNDGCNPESCRDVLIENCRFDTGDDCIAIKSGRNADGRRQAAPSENIVIRGCEMKDGHGGVVLGSEMSGGIRNVFAEDCVMDSPHLERAIRLKSNSMRGGFLENLYARNIRVGQVSDAAIRIDLLYDKDRGSHYPKVSNIYIENLTVEKCKLPLYLVGLKEEPIQNVEIKNCTIRNASRPSVVDDVQRLILLNFKLLPK